MTRTARLGGVVLVLGLAAGVGADTPGPARAPVTSRRDGHWVHGRVEIPAPPDAVWRRLQRVDAWRELFSDVRALRILEHRGSSWRLELDTRIMDCGPHDYWVRFGPGRVGRLEIDAPGVDARGRFTVREGTGMSPSVVTYDLYVEALGVIGWLVPEGSLHERQEAMVERYLGDLWRAFAAPTRTDAR